MQHEGETMWGERAEYSFPHIKPDSVLIAATGNAWVPHAWHRLQDMIVHAEKAGITVALQEIPDWSVLPSDAIANMRMAGAQLAVDAGVEWYVMLENDVLLEEDTLERLIARDMPCTAPLCIGTDGKIVKINEYLKPNTGLRPVRSAVFSMLMFRTNVFNCIGPEAFGIGIGTHEGPFWQKMWHFGHRLYVDTDTIVNLARDPSYNGNWEYDEIVEKTKENFYHYRLTRRDRRPPSDYDPTWTSDTNINNDVYRPAGPRPLERRFYIGC